jgi:hypothetical protein
MGIVIPTQSDSLTTLMALQPVFGTHIEDNTKLFYGTSVVAGQPLTIKTSGDQKGQLVVCSALTDVVYGLAKANIITAASYNEVNDYAYGMYGSGKITACIFGVYEITNFTYTLSDGTTRDLTAFNSTDITYAGYTPGAAVYTTAAGLITTVEGTGSVAFGRLLAVSADGKTIQVAVGF